MLNTQRSRSFKQDDALVAMFCPGQDVGEVCTEQTRMDTPGTVRGGEIVPNFHMQAAASICSASDRNVRVQRPCMYGLFAAFLFIRKIPRFN